MAALLASHSRLGDNLISFCTSLTNHNNFQFDYFPKKLVNVDRFHVHMQHKELPVLLSRNGKIIRMIPTTGIRDNVVNGSRKDINVDVVKGGSLLPPVEGLKVLPSDEGFSWANENYNSVQRTIDVWSCIISLRVRVLLDDAKWAYIRGWSKEKQVGL